MMQIYLKTGAVKYNISVNIGKKSANLQTFCPGRANRTTLIFCNTIVIFKKKKNFIPEVRFLCAQI